MNQETPKPWCLWLTGLSGAGKTTFARELERVLQCLGSQPRVFDGDEMRALKGQHFGYTKTDREKWNKYIAGTAGGVAASGRNVIVSMISPYDETRKLIRKHLIDDCLTPEPACTFHLVYINTPLDICESRDSKGLYAKARSGEIDHFTGISDPYDIPQDADLVLPYHETPRMWVARALNYLAYGRD